MDSSNAGYEIELLEPLRITVRLQASVASELISMAHGIGELAVEPYTLCDLRNRLLSRLFVVISYTATVAALLLVATSSSADAKLQQDNFTLLTYNVRGIPKGLRFPGRRFPTIGWLANRYDVVLAQEVFGGSRLLIGQMPDKQPFVGVGVLGSPGKVALRALTLPFTFFLPDFWPPFGSGLITFVEHRLLPEGDLTEAPEFETSPYRECYGWFSAGMDCFARKGYLRVPVQAPGGTLMDVYNTHLDAGTDEESRAARSAQLRELACAIDARDSGRPTIVAGDLNIAYSRKTDGILLSKFRQHLGLADSGAGAENPTWRERDFVLYRDGTDARLIVDRAGEESAFLFDGYALSDHPALFAEFRVAPRVAGEPGTPPRREQYDCAPEAS